MENSNQGLLAILVGWAIKKSIDSLAAPIGFG
jgi:hypothetical protein